MVMEAEAVLTLASAVKYIGGIFVTAVLGLIGWNVRSVVDRMNRVESELRDHEIDSAEKFGSINTSLKAFVDTALRLESNMSEIRSDIKGLLKK